MSSIRVVVAKTTTTTLDAQNRADLVNVPGLDSMDMQYDPQGRMRKVIHGTFANAGRVLADRTFYATSPTDPKSGYLQQFAAGLLTSTGGTTPQLTVALEPEAFGRTVKQTLDGNATLFEWDGANALTSLTPPGADAHFFTYAPTNTIYSPPYVTGMAASDTKFTFNLDGQLELVQYADGRSLDFEYDATKGQLQQILGGTGSGTVTFAYWAPPPTCPPNTPDFCPCTTAGCAPGKPSSVTGPSDVKVSFQYKGPLPLKEITEKKAGTAEVLTKTTLAWEYNADLLPSAEQLIWTGTGAYDIRSAFGYDNDGLVTCIERLATGACTAPTPTNLDIEQLTYDPGHGLVKTTTLQSIRDVYDYNQFGELKAYEAFFATPTESSLYRVAYDDGAANRRDPLGRVKRKTEVREGVTTTVDYQYDNSGRLWKATDAAGTRTYTYDANGNRISTHVYDEQDRLVSATGGAPQYFFTDAGALREKVVPGVGSTSYTYDVFGNLRQVLLKDVAGTVTKTIDYVVDGAGRRVAKKEGVPGPATARTKQFVYRNGLQIMAEIDGAGFLRSRFWYGSRKNVPDFMERRTGPGTFKLYRILSDQLGSPVLAVNVADKTDKLLDVKYDEWGNVMAGSTGVGEIPFGFAGGLYDTDTKLVRFGARDYDPETGRWTSKDPILFNGGQANLYVYVGNDPINWVDPTGEFVNVLIGAGIGAVAGGLGAAATGGDVWAGVAGGAVSGGLAGLTGGLSLGGQIIGGIGAGLVGLSVNEGVRLLDGSPSVGPAELAAATVVGGAGPVVGIGLRQLTEPGLSGIGEFATRRVAGSLTSFAIGAELRSTCGGQ